MKILFNPKPNEKGSGTTSFISFTQPEFQKAIETIIRKQKSEAIESIELDESGITVRLLSIASPLSDESGWKPGDTAPKDGTSILICDIKGRIGVGHFKQEKDDSIFVYVKTDENGQELYKEVKTSGGFWTWSEPAYWMPLPLPPNAELRCASDNERHS